MEGTDDITFVTDKRYNKAGIGVPLAQAEEAMSIPVPF